jgi:hypothetical protein
MRAALLWVCTALCRLLRRLARRTDQRHVRGIGLADQDHHTLACAEDRECFQDFFRIAPCLLLIVIDLDIARRTDADLQLEVPAAVDDPIIVIGVDGGSLRAGEDRTPGTQ